MRAISAITYVRISSILENVKVRRPDGKKLKKKLSSKCTRATRRLEISLLRKREGFRCILQKDSATLSRTNVSQMLLAGSELSRLLSHQHLVLIFLDFSFLRIVFFSFIYFFSFKLSPASREYEKFFEGGQTHIHVLVFSRICQYRIRRSETGINEKVFRGIRSGNFSL